MADEMGLPFTPLLGHRPGPQPVGPLIQHTRSGPPLEKARYERVRVSVTRGPNAGLVVEAAGRTLRVGTAPDSDVVLSDDTVSRRHCEIELGETGFRVRDVGSTNGLRCGALRVLEIEASQPIELSLGESTLSITPLAETEARDRVTSPRYHGLIGNSRRMRELFAEVERLSKTSLTVLIEGETGTGKDLVAEAMHRSSSRVDGPYVVFDCSAVAPTLIESELFGHDRGAFTGAAMARPGVFEEADGGTLFLDEIGELPKELQPKLLRALERREVKRLGGRRVITVDVRVVAATNRNLLSEVSAENFRQDLYYRIAGARVVLPPLRERVEDISMLMEHFLSIDAPQLSRASIAPEIWEMFCSHRWPGNVRELRNAVQRLVVAPELALHFSEEQKTSRNTRPAASNAGAHGDVSPLREARRAAAESFEQGYVRALLERTQGNVTRAAAIAEVSRQMVQKLMRKYGIRENT